MVSIFFIYGLAFFSMGLTVLLYPKRESSFRLAKSLWLIGAFGLLHGINEWLDMFIMLGKPEESISLEFVRTAILPVSYFFLLYFGINVIVEAKGKYKALKSLLVVLPLTWLVMAALSKEWFPAGNTWAGYLLGGPGIFLTAYALLEGSAEFKNKIPSVSLNLKIASAAFIFYGFFTGEIVPQAGFFLPSALNDAFAQIGIPIQVFRAFCAVVIAYNIIRALNVFIRWETKEAIEGLSIEVIKARDEQDLDINKRTSNLTQEITELKQAKEAIREKEHSYRTLAENVPGIVYRVFIREGNRMQFFNDMLQTMTGFRQEELSAGEVCSIEPLILDEDKRNVVNTVEHAIRNNLTFKVDYRLRHKRGNIQYFLELGRPIYGPDKFPLYIDGVIFDVTEYREMAETLRRTNEQLEEIVKERTSDLIKKVKEYEEAEAALKESEERCRAITSTVVDAIILVDNYGRLIYLNPAAERMFGWPGSEVIGKNMHLYFMPSRLHKGYEEELSRLRTEGQSFGRTIESVAVRRSGTEFPVEVSVSEVKIKGQRHTLRVIRDITERRQAEAELRESEYMYRTLVETMGYVIYVLEPDGKITSLNPAFEHVTGWSAAEWLGRHFVHIVHPDDVILASEMFIKVLHGESTPKFKLRILSKSGRYLLGEFAHAQYIKDGLLTGVIGIAIDITQ